MVVCGLRSGRDEADDLVEVDGWHPALEQALADVFEVCVPVVTRPLHDPAMPQRQAGCKQQYGWRHPNSLNDGRQLYTRRSDTKH